MPPRNCSSRNQTEGPERDLPQGAITLAVIVCLFAVTWLVWLPRLAEDPALQRRLELQEEQGVNSAAMFYSDLPAVDDAQHRLEKLQTEDPGLFWSP